MKRSGRHLTIIFLSLIACTFFCGCGPNSGFRGMIQKMGAKAVESSSDDSLRDMFKSASDHCPQKVDAFTTLQEVEVIDDQNVEFRYLVNDAGKQFASRFDKRALRQAMVESMRGNAMAVAIAERDLSIEHIYNDKYGGHILSYTINRAVLEGEDEPIGGEHANPFDAKPVKATPGDNVNVADKSKRGAPPHQVKPKPRLPRQFSGGKRTKDNPAGVQANPYVDKS